MLYFDDHDSSAQPRDIRDLNMQHVSSVVLAHHMCSVACIIPELTRLAELRSRRTFPYALLRASRQPRPRA